MNAIQHAMPHRHSISRSPLCYRSVIQSEWWITTGWKRGVLLLMVSWLLAGRWMHVDVVTDSEQTSPSARHPSRPLLVVLELAQYTLHFVHTHTRGARGILVHYFASNTFLPSSSSICSSFGIVGVEVAFCSPIYRWIRGLPVAYFVIAVAVCCCMDAIKQNNANAFIELKCVPTHAHPDGFMFMQRLAFAKRTKHGVWSESIFRSTKTKSNRIRSRHS